MTTRQGVPIICVYLYVAHYFHLYKMTSPSGRVYIGQTRRFKERMRRYKTAQCPKQRLLFSSLNKYGWETHRLEILAEGEMTQNEIDKLEQEKITEYKAAGISLNLADGGTGGIHWNSKAILQFDLKGNLLREWPSVTEAADHVGSANETCIGFAARTGRMYSHGYLWVYKANHNGKVPLVWDKLQNRTSFKAVIQCGLDGAFIAEYRGMGDAARTVGGKTSGIAGCVSGNQRQAYGFLWCLKTDYDRGVRPTLKQRAEYRLRKVIMCDKEGNVIQEFASSVEASRITGKSRSCIRQQCGKLIMKPRSDMCFKYKDDQSQS